MHPSSSQSQRLALVAPLALLASPLLTSVLAAPASQPPASALATTSSAPPQPIHLPIRSSLRRRTGSDLHSWANAQRSKARSKYGIADDAAAAASSSRRRRRRRRATTTTSANLTNYEDDDCWYAAVTIGTPSQGPFDVMLDTGSADVWIASSNFDASQSTTFANGTSSFSISYGSGKAEGWTARDVVSLAGQSASDQQFALVDSYTEGLVDDTLRGIFGLGWQQLSAADATPFWQSVGASQFSFYLNKVSTSASVTTSPSSNLPPGVSDSVSSAGGSAGSLASISSGSSSVSAASSSSSSSTGVFTLGGTNTSLYQGDISWNSLTSETYWVITLGGVTVGSTDLSLGGLTKAVIDTGTTLLGGPDSVVSSLYAQIPSASTSADSDGYYELPCDSDVNVTFSFGSQAYTLNTKQLLAGQVGGGGGGGGSSSSSSTCLGSIFSLGDVTSSTAVQWLVGDAFLANVYSVFDVAERRVGFASLAASLTSSSTGVTTSVSRFSQSSAAAPAASSASTPATLATLAAVALASTLVLLLA